MLRYSDMTRYGLPHSEIRGLASVCDYPRLFAAHCVLRRLPVPGQPPCALVRLTFHNFTRKFYSLACCHAGFYSFSEVVPFTFNLLPTTFHKSFVCFTYCFLKDLLSFFSMQFSRCKFSFGEGLVVEMSGIEPLTPCLQGRCSPS